MACRDAWGHRAELKGGLVYDTRDFEANPARGLYATVTLAGGASFSSGQSLSMVAAFDVRQYLPIVPSRLTLAWQVKGGGLVADTLPFYALPSFEMRGSFGNRIVGTDVFGGSLDLRLRIISRSGERHPSTPIHSRAETIAANSSGS